MKHPAGDAARAPRGKEKPPPAEPPPAPRAVAFLPPPAPTRPNLTDQTPRCGRSDLVRQGTHLSRYFAAHRAGFEPCPRRIVCRAQHPAPEGLFAAEYHHLSWMNFRRQTQASSVQGARARHAFPTLAPIAPPPPPACLPPHRSLLTTHEQVRPNLSRAQGTCNFSGPCWPTVQPLRRAPRKH